MINKIKRTIEKLNKKCKKRKYKYLIIVVLWLFSFSLLIWFANDINFSFPPSLPLKNLSELGSAFNILTSIFTGLAFAAILISIQVQRKELKKTQKEFFLQRFDDKFFQMLGIFNHVLRNIKNDKSERNAFLSDYCIKSFTFEKCNKVESFCRHYENINNEHYELKYYFLNLYQIFKYVDNAKLDSDDEKNYKKKKVYMNIIRAQLSKQELILLFYNCIGIYNISGKEYKRIVEEYVVFEHLRYENLKEYISDESVLDFLLSEYTIEKAFGRNIKEDKILIYDKPLHNDDLDSDW